MKARLVLDQFCNPANVTDEMRPFVKPAAAFGKVDYVFPAGTTFEGEQAVFMCRTGQCEPADEECMTALNLSANQRAAIQTNYRMSSLGINDPADRELYRAGVILGYDNKLEYIHGPNWEAYQKAITDLKKTEDDI